MFRGSYTDKLRQFNEWFESQLLDFLHVESMKCLVLETKDSTTAVMRVQRILEKSTTIYSDTNKQIMLNWNQLVEVVAVSKVLPKLTDLFLVEFSNSEPELHNSNILEVLMERVNIVPGKKVILIFNHQGCKHTYLNGIGVSDFLKIDEFNDKVTSLAKNDSSELLRDAARAGRINHVKALLSKDPNIVHSCDDKFNTALHCAAEFGDRNLVFALLQRGALISYNDCQNSPLHIAASYGHEDALKVLLEFDKSENVNETNKDGKTAAHLAVDLGHCGILEDLVEHGADLNKQDIDGCTPLHYAVRANDCKTVKLLVLKGASITVMDARGKTPLDLARERNYHDIEEVLMLKGKPSRRSVNLEMIWKD